MDKLSDRQRQVLRAIYDITRERGHAPTVRELGQQVGLRSSCTVQRHLETLEQKGFIRRNHTKARTVEIVKAEDPTIVPHRTRPVALVGTVAAGQPVLAVENIEEVYALPAELVPEEGCFLLRVKGDSMIGDGLFDGDLVVVRQQETADNGDVVVAMIDEEATVKRLYCEQGKVRLQPSNPKLQPIITNHAQIIGKVILSIRQYQ